MSCVFPTLEQLYIHNQRISLVDVTDVKIKGYTAIYTFDIIENLKGKRKSWEFTFAMDSFWGMKNRKLLEKGRYVVFDTNHLYLASCSNAVFKYNKEFQKKYKDLRIMKKRFENSKWQFYYFIDTYIFDLFNHKDYNSDYTLGKRLMKKWYNWISCDEMLISNLECTLIRPENCIIDENVWCRDMTIHESLAYEKRPELCKQTWWNWYWAWIYCECSWLDDATAITIQAIHAHRKAGNSNHRNDEQWCINTSDICVLEWWNWQKDDFTDTLINTSTTIEECLDPDDDYNLYTATLKSEFETIENIIDSRFWLRWYKYYNAWWYGCIEIFWW